MRELVNIGVPVLQPENILPKSSLSLTTKVAVAILDASASPMLLNAFRIRWRHPDGMSQRERTLTVLDAAILSCKGNIAHQVLALGAPLTLSLNDLYHSMP